MPTVAKKVNSSPIKSADLSLKALQNAAFTTKNEFSLSRGKEVDELDLHPQTP
jgi:hypothetical protein